MARGGKETVYATEVLTWATRLKAVAEQLQILGEGMEKRLGPLEVLEHYAGMKTGVNDASKFVQRLNESFEEANRDWELAHDASASDASESEEMRPISTSSEGTSGRKKASRKSKQSDK